MVRPNATRIADLHRRYGKVPERCGECALYYERQGGRGVCEMIDEERWKAGWQGCAKWMAKERNGA